MENLIIFLSTLWFIIGCVWIDALHIKDNDNVNHYARSYQRMIFFLVISFYNIQLAIASLFLFAGLFDSLLNICIEKPLFYLGTTAKWDRFWKKRKTIYKVFKLILLLSSCYLYFYGVLQN